MQCMLNMMTTDMKLSFQADIYIGCTVPISNQCCCAMSFPNLALAVSTDLVCMNSFTSFRPSAESACSYRPLNIKLMNIDLHLLFP